MGFAAPAICLLRSCICVQPLPSPPAGRSPPTASRLSSGRRLDRSGSRAARGCTYGVVMYLPLHYVFTTSSLSLSTPSLPLSTSSEAPLSLATCRGRWRTGTPSTTSRQRCHTFGSSSEFGLPICCLQKRLGRYQSRRFSRAFSSAYRRGVVRGAYRRALPS